MKVRTRVSVIFTALLFAVITCLSSYATAGMKGPEMTDNTVVAELAAGPADARADAPPADAIEASLEGLVRSGSPDAPESFPGCGAKETVASEQTDGKSESCTIRKAGYSSEDSGKQSEGMDKPWLAMFQTQYHN